MGGIPALFLVDKNGTIQAFYRGEGMPGENRESTIRHDLDLLLAGKPIPRTPVMASVTTPQTPQAMTPQVQGPSLMLDSLRQEIGMRKPGETVQHGLNLRNTGSEPVEIKSVKAASDDVKVDSNYDKAIAANSNRLVKLEIKVPDKPGPFTQNITIQSNDPKHPEQTVTLAGTARPFVEVQPPTGITFKGNPRVQNIPMLATLIYNGAGKIEYGKPESSSPKFEARIEPMQTARIRVRRVRNRCRTSPTTS